MQNVIWNITNKTSGIDPTTELVGNSINNFEKSPNNRESPGEKAIEYPRIIHKIDIKQAIPKCWHRTDKTFFDCTRPA